VVVSPKEGKTSKLGLQACLSCPGVSAHSGMVFIVVLLPCRGMAWHDATVPVMTVLLAWWWFTNYVLRDVILPRPSSSPPILLVASW
jgi:hypothetical protein